MRKFTNLTATSSTLRSSSTSSGQSGGTRQNVIVRYDAAAVQRAIQAGLSPQEAGSPDSTWRFKFTGSGDSRTWHASNNNGSTWKNIGRDPENATIKRLNAAFPEASQNNTEDDGDSAAANVATPDR